MFTLLSLKFFWGRFLSSENNLNLNGSVVKFLPCHIENSIGWWWTRLYYNIPSTKEIKVFIIVTFTLFFIFRLYGSYEALKAGNQRDSLTDLTGGLTESYTFHGPQANLPEGIVNILFKALERLSLIGCNINVSFDKILNGCYCKE